MDACINQTCHIYGGSVWLGGLGPCAHDQKVAGLNPVVSSVISPLTFSWA